jgi:hypothetical protein
VSNALDQPIFSRGRAIFDFAGNEFDKIADNYDCMQWWVSDSGLNMAIIESAPASSTEVGPSPKSAEVLTSGYIPSQQRMGVPSLDPQRSFPPSRHSFIGGPVDPKQRADLYEDIGWLAREIQALRAYRPARRSIVCSTARRGRSLGA